MFNLNKIKIALIVVLSALCVVSMARPGDGWNDDDRWNDNQRATKYVLRNIPGTQGYNLLIKVKQQLKQQHGLRNLNNQRITRIKVVSSDVDFGRRNRIKSQVRFELAGQVVGGAQRFQQNPNNGRYIANIHPPRHAFRTRGTWQIRSNDGYADIRRVVVWLQPKRNNGGGGGWNPPAPPSRLFSVGKKRIEKWNSGVAFSVNRNASVVALKMHRNSSKIGQVRVFFRHGGSVDLHQLSGHYSQGQTKSQRVNRSGLISHIEIYNSQSSLIGGRADVELLVGN